MKYVDEYRDRSLIDKVAREIRRAVEPGREYNFMEVCGTHTMAIFRFGLKSLLPGNIRLISGPGCPVCVTPNSFIDKAIALSRQEGVIVATFGDMFRVPGSYSSLEKERSRGADVRTVYSTTEALNLAGRNHDKEVVFLGVGFETTIPTVASSIVTAKDKGLKNYSVLCGHKTMPAALKALAGDRNINVDGLMLPGHVSVITGKGPYEFLAKTYKKRCVIAGFEPLDIMQAVLMLIEQRKPGVGVQYTRIINKSGNGIARRLIEKVFLPVSSDWRGIGKIGNSGLRIRNEYSDLDAEMKFKVRIAPPKENKGCICGDVLKGIATPLECKLFGKRCNPESPVGSCMVSSEGTCAAYFKYSA